LLSAVLAGAVLLIQPIVSFAQSNAEGYLYGTAPAGASTVTAVNVGTGQTRAATVGTDGKFIIPSLPTGVYSVTAKKGDAVIQTTDELSVGVGAGTSVRFDGDNSTMQLEKFVVGGSAAFSPIDSSQTGASLQIRKEMVDLLPVARDLSAVMNLAPGVSKGDAAFGSSPSFAGASVAENNVYINGINHGFDAEAFIRQLPAGRIGQIHLAGHDDRADDSLHVQGYGHLRR